MSVLAVRDENPVEQLIGLIVREARRLVNKDWTALVKNRVREMIRIYGDARRAGKDHGAARRFARNRVKCPKAQEKFMTVINQAVARLCHPARNVI